FGARGPTLAVTRIDRLPRNSEVVVTRVLPTAGRLNALGRSEGSLIDEARRHRVVLPEARTTAGDPVSFRTIEVRRPQPARSSPSQRMALPGATRAAVPAIPDPMRPPSALRRVPAAVPRVVQHPATPGTTLTPASPPSHDPAVGRLIQGVRPVPGA